MKHITLALVAILTLAMTSIAGAADKPAAKSTEKVRHIVVFKFKEGTTRQAIAEMEKAFKALKGQVPGLLSFENGENNSPEGLNNGFTHVYLVTFDNEASRDAYLTHPAHLAFVEKLKPILDEVFVVDFSSGKKQ